MPSELSIIRQFDRAMSHFAGVSNKSDEEIEKTSRLIGYILDDRETRREIFVRVSKEDDETIEDGKAVEDDKANRK